MVGVGVKELIYLGVVMKSVDKFKKKEKLFTEDGKDHKIIVKYGMSYIRGNSRPYFSITVSSKEYCGCIHDEIALHFPELKPLIQFHLWNDNGLPMHYVANAIYWWEYWQGLSKWKLEKTKEEYFEIFCDHIALFPDEVVPVTREEIKPWLENRIPRIQELFNKTMDEFGIERIVVE
jgi:hypothetical protein